MINNVNENNKNEIDLIVNKLHEISDLYYNKDFKHIFEYKSLLNQINKLLNESKLNASYYFYKDLFDKNIELFTSIVLSELNISCDDNKIFFTKNSEFNELIIYYIKNNNYVITILNEEILNKIYYKITHLLNIK